MTFDVPATAYARFMGRYSTPLATELAELVGLVPGQRALDVGCGAGALTRVLVERLGADHVSAVDPSEPFVSEVRRAFPAADVRRATAEDLPFADAGFDRVLAQLVVHFMSEPARGLAEMARVAAPGGVVAASVWDHAGGRGPLATFWRAAHDVAPGTVDEASLPGVREGHLAELFAAAGMERATSTALTVWVTDPTFDEWWEPYTLGVGPAGAYVAALDAEHRDALRERCRELLPPGPVTVEATAWTAWWRKP